MEDVYLEGVTPDGPAMVGHLSVTVDEEGLTVMGPAPDARRTVGWDRLSSLEFGPAVTLPGGVPGTSMHIVLDGRPLRLLVPSAPAAGVSMAELRPIVAPPPVEVLHFPAPPDPVLPGPDLADPVAIGSVPVAPALPAAGAASLVWTDPDAAVPAAPPEAEPSAVPLRPVVPAAVRRGRRMAFRVRRLRRVALITVLLGLLPIAGGMWFFHYRGAPTVPAGSSLSDAAIAIRVGLQPGDLPGWKSSPTEANNVFAAGSATAGPSAAATAAQSATVVARCLHVPVSALEAAFGMGSPAGQQTAEVASPLYAAPSGGGAVSSLVEVVASSQAGQADAQVFADPSLFATCYQPYVQAMLPYDKSPAAPGGFATDTVEPIVVPLPYSPTVEVAAFQIARIGNVHGQTVNEITIAVAVFGGRVLATANMVSNFVFPLDTQLQVVRAVEARVVGVDQF